MNDTLHIYGTFITKTFPSSDVPRSRNLAKTGNDNIPSKHWRFEQQGTAGDVVHHESTDDHGVQWRFNDTSSSTFSSPQALRLYRVRWMWVFAARARDPADGENQTREDVS